MMFRRIARRCQRQRARGERRTQSQPLPAGALSHWLTRMSDEMCDDRG